MNKLRALALAAIMLFLSGCATSNHGSFARSTYAKPGDEIASKQTAKVTGVSKQVWLFYVFPMGDAPSTDEAVSDAKSRIEGTKFLTDLSIDDRVNWKIGYSEQVIEVKATANK